MKTYLRAFGLGTLSLISAAINCYAAGPFKLDVQVDHARKVGELSLVKVTVEDEKNQATPSDEDIRVLIVALDSKGNILESNLVPLARYQTSASTVFQFNGAGLVHIMATADPNHIHGGDNYLLVQESSH